MDRNALCLCRTVQSVSASVTFYGSAEKSYRIPQGDAVGPALSRVRLRESCIPLPITARSKLSTHRSGIIMGLEQMFSIDAGRSTYRLCRLCGFAANMLGQRRWPGRCEYPQTRWVFHSVSRSPPGGSWNRTEDKSCFALGNRVYVGKNAFEGTRISVMPILRLPVSQASGTPSDTLGNADVPHLRPVCTCCEAINGNA